MRAFLIYCYLLFIFDTFLSSTRADLACTPSGKSKNSILFEIIGAHVFNNPKNWTEFLLYTNKNKNCYQLLSAKTLKESDFNSKFPTRFLIHGYMNSPFHPFSEKLKDAYLNKGFFNVIVVNWEKIALNANYNTATNYVEVVGHVVAEFAQLLHTEKNVPYNDMYVIGHSLGAHIAGVAGNLVPEKFNTIFALDPAGPNFEFNKGGPKINQTSAKYVEAIHTNMGFLGFEHPIGDASFFPNFGKKQNGCNKFVGQQCSHTRSYEYMVESINSKTGFWGIECGDILYVKYSLCIDKGVRGIMGGEPSTPKRGLYYVPTNDQFPFAKGYHITLVKRNKLPHKKPYMNLN